MQAIEIITIISAVAIVVGVIVSSIIKKKKNKKTGCGCNCSSCPYACSNKSR